MPTSGTDTSQPPPDKHGAAPLVPPVDVAVLSGRNPIATEPATVCMPPSAPLQVVLIWTGCPLPFLPVKDMLRGTAKGRAGITIGESWVINIPDCVNGVEPKCGGASESARWLALGRRSRTPRQPRRPWRVVMFSYYLFACLVCFVVCCLLVWLPQLLGDSIIG